MFIHHGPTYRTRISRDRRTCLSEESMCWEVDQMQKAGILSLDRMRFLVRVGVKNLYGRLVAMLGQTGASLQDDFISEFLEIYRQRYGFIEEWCRRPPRVEDDLMEFVQFVAANGCPKFATKLVSNTFDWDLLQCVIERLSPSDLPFLVHDLVFTYLFGVRTRYETGELCLYCGKGQIVEAGAHRRWAFNRPTICSHCNTGDMARWWAKSILKRFVRYCAKRCKQAGQQVRMNDIKMIMLKNRTTDVSGDECPMLLDLLDSVPRRNDVKIFSFPTFTTRCAIVTFRMHHPSVWRDLAIKLLIGPFQSISARAMEGLAYHCGAFVAQDIQCIHLQTSCSISRADVPARRLRKSAARGCAMRRLATHGRGVRMPHHLLRHIFEYMYFDSFKMAYAAVAGPDF